MMTNGEIRRDEIQTASLRKIADELERANKLKALEFRADHNRMTDKAFREELTRIMES